MTRLVKALLVLLAGLAGAQAQAQATKAPRDLVRASLIADTTAIVPGQPFALGIRMRMKPGWHVYWRNPGDSGLPPELAWNLPDGIAAGAIAWPAPRRIPVATLMNYGYEGETVLLVPVTPSSGLAPDTPVTLGARLSYLVCEEICIPGSADLSLTLPVGVDDGATDPAAQALIARARASMPEPSPWPVTVRADGERLRLNVERPGLPPDAIRDAAFFPYAETVLDNAAPQDLTVDGAGLHLVLSRADATTAPPAELAGVLTFREETESGTLDRAFSIGQPSVPPTASAPAVAVDAVPPTHADDDAPTVWGAAGLALLGGLLLNLMPCVFPVLSIKLLGLVKQAGEAPGRIRLHGAAYTLGVLASFLTLAGLLIALKGGGAGIGWGFQLQSPVVVALLAYLLFAMGLSLSGVVHLGGRLNGIGDGLTRRAGYQGSFFTGVLATVVATPCTAPFMGAAVGFALTQAPVVGLAVFASLGLGLALPFLLLTLWPGALRVMPRPGAWMDTLKGALAFPVYATVAWLVWVLAQQVGPNGLLAGLTGLVLIGLAAWSWERAGAGGSVAGPLTRGVALAAVLAAAGLVGVLNGERAGAVSAPADGVEPFTQARLDALRAQGRTVFVDMTAAWCITCQVNERTALAGTRVREAFQAGNVAYLRGDWTNQNPEITRLLERYGRSGVPLYLLYRGQAEAVVLPQILTGGIVLGELARLGVADVRRTGALDDAAR